MEYAPNEYTYRCFTLYAPREAREMISWKMTGRHELTAYFEDGHAIVYNEIHNYTRYIPPKPERPETREEFKNRISRVLHDRIRDQPNTQDRLAERAGISRQAIYNITHGKAIPDTFTFFKICEVLGCDTNEIIYHD